MRVGWGPVPGRVPVLLEKLDQDPDPEEKENEVAWGRKKQRERRECIERRLE